MERCAEIAANPVRAKTQGGTRGVQECTAMALDWDDLRFVAALSRFGSLSQTASRLGVEHTTVGRRIVAAESALGVRLFRRTPSGYVLTVDGERLVAPLSLVEGAVANLERGVAAKRNELEGSVRVTAPETLGIALLAPWLAKFNTEHPSLRIELVPAGTLLDLNRGEAEVAVRTFRTKHERLVVRAMGHVSYGLYASAATLARWPVKTVKDLKRAPLIAPTNGVDRTWLDALVPHAQPVFVSEVSLALRSAAESGTGFAVLPRYLGDDAATLVHVPMPRAPSEALYLTLHRDLRQTPRVRVLVDFLVDSFAKAQRVLDGRSRVQ
jgi:DNA-binding transcriptional LysR family regulator